MLLHDGVVAEELQSSDTKYNKVALSKLARFVCKLKEVQVP